MNLPMKLQLNQTADNRQLSDESADFREMLNYITYYISLHIILSYLLRLSAYTPEYTRRDTTLKYYAITHFN